MSAPARLKQRSGRPQERLPAVRPEPVEGRALISLAEELELQRLRERSRQVQLIAVRVQLAILALAGLSVLVGLPFFVRNIARGLLP